MNASVSIKDLLHVLLPPDGRGVLGMLTAYFDDSGTHEPSKIVVMAGIFGLEYELCTLERQWRKHLLSPLCGMKQPLKRFHMAECQASDGEFLGWSRTETDYFCHQLQSEIIESRVAGYGFACVRKDWDELVTGDLLALFGTAEQYCIRNCFVRAIGWAQRSTFDPQMTFVFDSRPAEQQRDTRAVFDAFERWVDPPPQLVGSAYLSSMKVPLLQAADLVAWEFYQYANDYLLSGFHEPRRRQFKELNAKMHFQAQIAERSGIMKAVELATTQRTGDELRQMGDHFRYFDPNLKGGE